MTNIKPTTGNEAITFLCEITSEARAKAILEIYPNFIEMVLNDEVVKYEKIKNVGKKTIEKIIKKVKSQLIYYDLIVEYKEYNLTLNQIKKIYDAYSSIEEIRNKMKENPYKCLCNLAGIGFKTADEKILTKEPGFAKTAFRMIECIKYVLTQNELNGNTYMLCDDLYNECKKNTPECIKFYDYVLKNSKQLYLSEDGNKISKLETYVCEEEIAKLLLDFSNSNTQWKDDKGLLLDPENIPQKYKQIDDIILTEQQNKTIQEVLKSNLVILAGYAGTGKSSSCKALINFFEDNSYSYMLLAPTGRATSVLTNYTERMAFTIHRGLGADGSGSFSYDEFNKINVSAVIIDETSMVDIFLMRALLKALPSWCKIIFVCDPAQIPSVGPGNVVQDMIYSNMFSVVMLDKVFRYEEGGLSYVATNVRQGCSFLSADQHQELGVKKDYVFTALNDGDIRHEAVKQYVDLYYSGIDINNIVVISCYNRGSYGTYIINNMIQNIINPPTQINDGKICVTKDNVNIKFNVNDRVMMTKNNYHVELYNEPDEECILYNGDFGVIKNITDNLELICQFGENLVRLSKSDAKELLLGYSVSCHKMQGDSRDYIIFVTPSAHVYMMNRNLVYVAFTRAKKKLYHYGNRKTIQIALKKSENLSRKTLILDLLKNLNKIEKLS